jgi:YhcH/YjgK/YiaL family protein
MIIESMANAHRYAELHPLLAEAFAWIGETDMDAAADGKSDIADGLKAIISTAPGKTAEASTAKFECHNQNIDIQLCIRGTETIGWRPRQSCEQPNGEFNVEKDVQFYHDAPHMFFQLQPGQFAIFFPEDVHAPMIGDGEIKKLVVKVRI